MSPTTFIKPYWPDAALAPSNLRLPENKIIKVIKSLKQCVKYKTYLSTPFQAPCPQNVVSSSTSAKFIAIKLEPEMLSMV